MRYAKLAAVPVVIALVFLAVWLTVYRVPAGPRTDLPLKLVMELRLVEEKDSAAFGDPAAVVFRTGPDQAFFDLEDMVAGDDQSIITAPRPAIPTAGGPSGEEQEEEKIPETELVKTTMSNGREIYLHKRNGVLIFNADIRRAEVRYGDDGWAVFVEFYPGAAERVRVFTRKNIRRQIAIMINGEVRSTPTIISEFGPKGVITGFRTRSDAERAVTVLAGE